MTSTDEAKYLGALITRTIIPRDEIRKRISATMVVLKKLDVFWLKNQCSKKWKLLVYNAVITSKVLYGLQTLEPTESASRLLNTFQLRGLRKILRLHTTYIQRQNTNEYVYRRANEIGNGAIKPLTEILAERKMRLLGHMFYVESDSTHSTKVLSLINMIPKHFKKTMISRTKTETNCLHGWLPYKSLAPLVRTAR